MERYLVIAAIAIGIFIGSDCLTIQDGKLINRCGIWQWISNSSLVLIVEKKEFVKPNTIIFSSPTPQQPTTLPMSSSIVTFSNTGTITGMSMQYCDYKGCR